MYAIIKNNTITQVGDLFTLSSGVFIRPEGSAYADWASANNVREVIEGEQKDQRFYWVTFDSYTLGDVFVTRNYTNTPKALEDVTETPQGATEPITTKGLKSQWVAQIKAAANSQLAATDWMVIRKAERDVAIPADVMAARAAIVSDCNTKEAAILAATTVDELMAVVAPVNTVIPS